MTVSPKNIFRFLVIIASAFLITRFFPIFISSATFNILPMVLVYSFLIGFLINRALDRKLGLKNSVAIELSRLRRLNHISEAIKDDAIHGNLKSAIIDYQNEVSKNFKLYINAHEAFRKITHIIYKWIPGNSHEEVLLNEFMETSRDLALHRQNIRIYIERHLSPYSWLFMFTMTAFLASVILIERASVLSSYIISSVNVASVFLAIDFLHKIDKLNDDELLTFQD